MAAEDYLAARKLAQKAARAAVSKGQYPYLPALEEFVPRDAICGEEPLGVIDIPLNKVAGTRTSARKNSFANNFMPLLAEDTEFARKWSDLYDAQMEEGIRDPILAYEYMMRYYVQEGNKRVSVLKFVEAASISANVIRLLPKKTADPQVQLYYEYVDFYEASKICSLDFSTSGSYEELCKFYDKTLKQPWTDEEREQLNSDFARFERIFSNIGGGRLRVTVADAFLVYLRVYGREELPYRSDSDITNEMDRIWHEFLTQGQDRSTKLLLEPSETTTTASLIKKHLPFLGGSGNKTLRVGFVYGKTPQTSAWTYAHELGRLYLESVFGDQICTKTYCHADYAFSPLDILEQAIRDENEIIFTTTPYLSAASLKAAVAHPEIKILNCSTNSTYNSIRTYYCRMYEPKFLLGLIAGALCGDGRIGYIADYPIFSTISNINAFALGVKMVNPHARIQLVWSSQKSDVSPQEQLDPAIRFVSDKDFIVPKHPDRRFGLYERTEGEPRSLATTVCHWGKFYEQILRGIRNDTWTMDLTVNRNRAINYWWGMSAGVTELICSDKLPTEVRRLVEVMTGLIRTGQFRLFDTKLIDRDGICRQNEGERMSYEKIAKMDWLLENVDGSIPTFGEMKDEALPLVLLQGELAPDDKGE